MKAVGSLDGRQTDIVGNNGIFAVEDGRSLVFVVPRLYGQNSVRIKWRDSVEG